MKRILGGKPAAAGSAGFSRSKAPVPARDGVLESPLLVVMPFKMHALENLRVVDKRHA